jgi:hypothetical protein
MLHEIKNMQDVILFIDIIANEIKDANPFEEFSKCKADVPGNIYTAKEAAQRSKLMDKCFEVCSRQKKSFIYLMLVLWEEARNKHPS